MYNILAKNDSYLGFTDKMTAMQRGRVEKVLTRKIRYDGGKVQERRDHILDLILKECDVFTYEDSKICYGIRAEKDSNSFYKITKNEYDFGMYLIENGLNTEKSVIAKIDAEAEERKRIAEENAEAERIEREAAQRKIEEEKAFKAWIKEELEHYPDDEKKALHSQIFTDIYGTIREWNHTSLVLIDHFDDTRCKKELHQYLETHNKGTRKYFECVTGLKLPKTNKETRAFIDSITTADFKEPKPYKKRKQPKEKELEVFYIAEMDENGKSNFVAVQGERLEKYGLHLFFHTVKESHGSYTVDRVGISSKDCGYRLVLADTKTEALNKLKEAVDKNGKEKILELIGNIGESKGWSPLCYKTA